MPKYLDYEGTVYLLEKIKKELQTKVDAGTLSDVAFSGSYNDLLDTPQHLRVDTIDNLETLVFTY